MALRDEKLSDGSARREISAIDASHVICYELHIQQ